MDENMKALCEACEVNFESLLEKLRQKVVGEHPDCNLSAMEAKVVYAAMEVAAGI